MFSLGTWSLAECHDIKLGHSELPVIDENGDILEIEVLKLKCSLQFSTVWT